MFFSYTNHAQSRSRKRGIPEEVIECIDQHGDISYAPGGAIKIRIPRNKINQIIHELKRTIRIFEKSEGVVLIEKEGNILTVYHAN